MKDMFRKPDADSGPTDRTLAQQLQITDREIQSRMDLLDFTDDDVKALTALRPMAEEKLETIVDAFYKRQLQSREIALVIGDADTLERLRASMCRYILELFEGYYDGEYVNRRLRIGKVHKRIGVSPKLYVSALSLLQTTLFEHLLASKTKNGMEESDTCDAERNAIRKLMMFDMQLVFDTYIASLVAEVETAKSELEEYAESLEQTIDERTRQLKELSVRDGLTELYNQRGFHDHLRRELSVMERGMSPLTLVYFDLNGFKKLNDKKGHKEGDRLLQLVGKSILESIRDVDFGCRYGGDEFCIIMPRTTVELAHDVYDRVIETFDAGVTHGITFSAGLAQAGPEAYDPPDQLIKIADALMYKAKAKSKKKPGHYSEPARQAAAQKA